MSGMLEFDERQARAVEAMYQNPDVTGQRAEVLRRLELRPGETVLDVGVGPGLLLRDHGAIGWSGRQGRGAGYERADDRDRQTPLRRAGAGFV